MRNLSKSKLLAYRQCPKRVWLEINRPDLREDSGATEANFRLGHQVGDLARDLYDPGHVGVFIDINQDGFKAAFEITAACMESDKPVFEAAFTYGGALALADVMLPLSSGKQPEWHMIEVKSSTSVKDYHRDDVAVQAYLAESSGVTIQKVSLACIDSSWTYPGGNDYRGLLKETDLTEEALSRNEEVMSWIADAHHVVAEEEVPSISVGNQCHQPYECGFFEYCNRNKPIAKHPVEWLPGAQSKALRTYIEENSVIDLESVPDSLLNVKQLRVKQHSLSDEPFYDAEGASKDLEPYAYPAYFLDFETIQFAVPIWAGTRPYQQIPFQFSLHRLSMDSELTHCSFLDLSGEDPSSQFAKELIRLCGKEGPIFVYSAFEKSRIKDLAERFPQLNDDLLSINERIVDLLPIAREHFYHPSQCGSWSIKKVLPAIAPDLNYEELDGVQDGGMAMDAFLEAITPETGKPRKEQIEDQLLKYCEMDTYAMVRLWQYFVGDERKLTVKRI